MKVSVGLLQHAADCLPVGPLGVGVSQRRRFGAKTRASAVTARETPSLEAYRAYTEAWLHLETLDLREIPRAIADSFHLGLLTLLFVLVFRPGTGSEADNWRRASAVLNVTLIATAVCVLGLGMVVTVSPLTTTVMNSIGAERSGLASGINNAVSRARRVLCIGPMSTHMRGFNRLRGRRHARDHRGER